MPSAVSGRGVPGGRRPKQAEVGRNRPKPPLGNTVRRPGDFGLLRPASACFGLRPRAGAGSPAVGSASPVRGGPTGLRDPTQPPGPPRRRWGLRLTPPPWRSLGGRAARGRRGIPRGGMSRTSKNRPGGCLCLTRPAAGRGIPRRRTEGTFFVPDKFPRRIRMPSAVGAESPGGRRLKQAQTGSNRVNTPLRNTVRRPGVLSLFEPV